MAYAPIAFTAPNYRDNANEWIKAYEPGTTTPKVMALESNGGTQVAKLQLNADGFIVSAGAALVIPYLSGAYDLWLFPTEAEADANNTANAIRLADNILGVLSDLEIEALLINDLSQAYEFATLNDAVTSNIVFPVGKIINIKERTTGNGGGAVWDVVLASSVTTNSYTIVACTGVPALALVLRISSVMDIRIFGVSTGVADNSLGLVYAIKSGVTKLIGSPSDVYPYTSNVTVVGYDVSLEDVNFTSETGNTIDIQGALVGIGQLTSGGEKYTRVVGLADTSNADEGDLIIIHDSIPYSFSKHRSAYTDGEFNHVTDKDASILITETPLKGVDNYPVAATTNVYRVDSVKVTLKNCSFKTNGAAAYALILRYAEGVNLTNTSVRTNDTTVGSLWLNKCYGVNIIGGNYFHEAANVGLNYGIAVTNSEQVLIVNADLYATRHAVTTGGDTANGSVPCRKVHILDSKVSNNPNSLIYSADFHGNTVDSSYEGCEISNGAGLAGENISLKGSTITPRAAGIPIQLHELVGGDYKIYNNHVKLPDFFTFDKIVGHGSSAISANVDRDYHIDIQDLNTDVRGTVVQIVNAFHNAVASVKHKWTVRGLSVNAIDDSLLTEIMDATITGTGTRPDYLEVSDCYYEPHVNTGAYLRVSSVVAFGGCTVTLPSSFIEGDLEIAASGWVSTLGSSSGTLLLNHPEYPTLPTVKADIVDGGYKGVSPTVFAFPVETFNTGQSQIVTATAGNSMTVTGNELRKVRLTVSYDHIIL